MRRPRGLFSCARVTGSPRQKEAGQVTVLFVFASLAFVLLLGFILNTAKQTSRKIQMQGAGDAAAIAGGTWMARGMNVMVINNQGMTDVLSLMIAVHSVVQTAKIMPTILAPFIAAAEETGQVELVEELGLEVTFYNRVYDQLKPLDDQLSDPAGGQGWSLMQEMDRFNQSVKGAYPSTANSSARGYAQKNRARDAQLFSGGPDAMPAFPAARGPSEDLVRHIGDCCLDTLGAQTKIALLRACDANAAPCSFGFIAVLVFNEAVSQNLSSLSGTEDLYKKIHLTRDQLRNKQPAPTYDQAGKTTQTTLDKTLSRPSYSYTLGKPLVWPPDPPRPMLLTDQPLPDPGAVIPDAGPDLDILKVRKRLQFLAVANADVERHGTIGGEKFINPASAWITYAQADVYNPTGWSMFSQNWRVKLARATVLNEKPNLLQQGGFSSGGGLPDVSFVNTH